MGGKWVMPTKADLKELYNNTTRQVMTINDKKGMLFTSNINGKSIFVVFAGYWNCYDDKFFNIGQYCYLRSSKVSSIDSGYVLRLSCYYIGSCGVYSARARAYWYSVRGVLKTKKVL